MSAATRWGVVGTGKAAGEFVNAVKALSQNDHVISAVAARKPEAAKKFAARRGLQCQTHGSFAALAKDPAVDVAYVGVVTRAHFRVTRMMLSAGKSVLCEAPLALNAKRIRQLHRVAAEKKVFLAEAEWTKHLPAHAKMRNLIKKGRIGKPRSVVMTIGIRLRNPKNAGGKNASEDESTPSQLVECISRCAKMALFVFGGEKPTKVTVVGSDDKVGAAATVVMAFSGDRFATFVVDLAAEMSDECEVFGTEGSLKLGRKFFNGTDLALVKRGEVVKTFSFTPLAEKEGEDNDGEKEEVEGTGGLFRSYQIEAVRRSLREKKDGSAEQGESAAAAEVVEEVARQMGVEADGQEEED